VNREAALLEGHLPFRLSRSANGVRLNLCVKMAERNYKVFEGCVASINYLDHARWEWDDPQCQRAVNWLLDFGLCIVAQDIPNAVRDALDLPRRGRRPETSVKWVPNAGT